YRLNRAVGQHHANLCCCEIASDRPGIRSVRTGSGSSFAGTSISSIATTAILYGGWRLIVVCNGKYNKVPATGMLN
ncbi:hypothetical protein GE21DRAFT_1355023, partial [Neurospora crassa]